MKTVLLILIILTSSIAYSQFITVDYSTVGEVKERNHITLGHKNDLGAPMVNIYLWELLKNEKTLLLLEKWDSDNWHYHSFNVTGWKTGSYKFIVGFGMDVERRIDFLVWNRE